jgi:hypothetical protein
MPALFASVVPCLFRPVFSRFGAGFVARLSGSGQVPVCASGRMTAAQF